MKATNQNTIILTLFDVMSKAIPRGMNAMPIAKKAGRTVPAVKIGCQAGNRCCLNLESVRQKYNYICTLYLNWTR